MTHYNPMVDRVALAIVGALKLNTTIGPNEREVARQALAALCDHWDREMRFLEARQDILCGMMGVQPPTGIYAIDRRANDIDSALAAGKPVPMPSRS